MNLKTNSILAALALAITTSAQAGPGPRDPGVITPRPLVPREVTMSCSRCQQPTHTVEHRAAKATRAYATTTPKTGMRTVM
jgi:hypothetical protein